MSWLITVALACAALWGCAIPVRQERDTLQERLVQAAVQDRESAYEQLARTMTAYCGAKHATLDARYACMLDRRFELLHLRRVQQD